MRKIVLTARAYIGFLFFICAAHSCSTNTGQSEYLLSSPTALLTLPAILHEVSGITYLGNKQIACVQDEIGVVFVYDVGKKSIVRHFTFGADGDYEGIARVGKSLYVLRSDGLLVHIEDYRMRQPRTSIFNTGVPANDNEGLCYDSLKNRLLIGCKSNLRGGSDLKNKRGIFAFDLATKRLSPEPVFVFDVNELARFAMANGSYPSKKTDMEKGIRLRISAIGIHPLTHKLYLLSAKDHMLFVFDANGSVEQVTYLDPGIFKKSEGITFFENGDMLISNEGRKGNPSLVGINYKGAGRNGSQKN